MICIEEISNGVIVEIKTDVSNKKIFFNDKQKFKIFLNEIEEQYASLMIDPITDSITETSTEELKLSELHCKHGIEFNNFKIDRKKHARLRVF
jgi:hypothetical protein